MRLLKVGHIRTSKKDQIAEIQLLPRKTGRGCIRCRHYPRRTGRIRRGGATTRGTSNLQVHKNRLIYKDASV